MSRDCPSIQRLSEWVDFLSSRFLFQIFGIAYFFDVLPKCTGESSGTALIALACAYVAGIILLYISPRISFLRTYVELWIYISCGLVSMWPSKERLCWSRRRCWVAVLSLFCTVQIVVATFTFLLVQVLLIKEGGRREAIELIAFSSWASGFAAGIPIWMTVLIFLFLQAR